nr:YciI family protein [Lusitaniella coriacea]
MIGKVWQNNGESPALNSSEEKSHKIKDFLNTSQLMPWFVKIEKGIVDKTTFDQNVPAHIAYVRDLIAKGHKAKSGYWAEYGGGMLLFEAASPEEAQEIVEADPLIATGCVNYELHEWRIVVD